MAAPDRYRSNGRAETAAVRKIAISQLMSKLDSPEWYKAGRNCFWMAEAGLAALMAELQTRPNILKRDRPQGDRREK